MIWTNVDHIIEKTKNKFIEQLALDQQGNDEVRVKDTFKQEKIMKQMLSKKDSFLGPKSGMFLPTVTFQVCNWRWHLLL